MRITFDQRKGALVNAAFGVAVAVLGYVWDVPFGTVVMWIGIAWVALSVTAYSDERVTELGDVLTYRTRRKERKLPRHDVVEVAVRVRREHHRRRKRSALPWAVEIWGRGKKPFASYSFQEEGPAREFAAHLSNAMGAELVDRTGPPGPEGAPSGRL